MLEYLNEYFDKFIKPYHPYEDKEFYQILIKFIQDRFLVDTYDEVPKNFKILFEDHTLIADIYDVVLESLGYDKTLLNELSFNQKRIILNNFTDYHRDKGDLKSIKTICKMFNEPISLYELYIDYRVSTSLFDWYFIPKPIVLSPTTKKDDIIPLDYDEIYNGTPSYFVNKASLINAYRNKAIKLPLKSNLMLLEVSSTTSADELTNLTISTTLFHFQELVIPIYINQNNYSISIIGLYQLWNYLLMFLYNKVDSFETAKPILLYNLDVEEFQYTLDESQPNNLQSVINEYNSLTGLTDITEFYDTKFKSVFLDYVTPHVVSIDTIRRNLAFKIDINLLQNIDNLLKDKSAEIISSILSDLRNSLVNYINTINEDPLFEEYSSVLLNVFELALVNPLNTGSYKLIDYFKPYHTQLISKFKYGIEYKSKFTNTLLKQTVRFVTHQYEASACVISDDVWFSDRLEGTCNVMNSTEIVVTDEIADQFDAPWENYIYWKDEYSRFPIDLSQRVVSKFWTDGSPGYWTLVLESNWEGKTGVLDYCYKRYHEIEI